MILKTFALSCALALPALAQGSKTASPDKPYYGYPPTFEEAFGHGAQSLVGPQNVGKNVLVSNDAPNRWQHEYSIAINPRNPNQVLASSNDYRTGRVKLGRHASFDGGKTFSADGVLPLASGWTDAGDPGVCFDGFGNGYIMGLHFTRSPFAGAIQIHKTTDGGRSFAAPVRAFSSSGNLPDKPLITADQRTSGPFAGSLYVTFTGFFRAPTGLQLIYSRNGGTTWSSPRPIGTGQGTSPAVGPNGEVYIAWQAGSAIQINRSFNGGQSFAGVRSVARISRNPSPLSPTRFRCNSFPSCAVDRSNGPHRGRVHVTWSSRRSGSSEIFASYSDDRGATWSSPRIINDRTNGDQFFQWMAVDEAGAVFCCWMDRRNDPSNRSYECYATASMNGGVTWLRNWKASETLNNPGSSSFLGDYNGLDARRGRAFATWVDFRRGNQDLYTAAIQSDLEFSPVQLSAAAGGTVQLPIKAGPARANDAYVLLASGGTNAGIQIGNANFVLNIDPILSLSLAALNQPPFVGFLGTLGTGGIPSTQPRFVAAPGLLAPLAGRSLSFAFLTIDGSNGFDYGSNPVTVQISN